jgi:hypothetical protein
VATTSGLLAFVLASFQTIAAAPFIQDTHSFRGGYPTREASARLYDGLDYQRAVQAYLWATPLVNSMGFMKALVRAGVTPGEPSLLVFDQRLTPKQVIMTANAEVIYAFSVFDLGGSTISRGSIDCRDAMRAVARYFSKCGIQCPRHELASHNRLGNLVTRDLPSQADADQLLEHSQLTEWLGNSA